MTKSNSLLLGIDIGGTKVAAGLVTISGRVLVAARAAMVTRKTAADGLRAVTRAVDAVMRDSRADRLPAIGISVPGWVDTSQGVLLSATSLPCWRNFPLAQEIQTRYGKPAHLANDANAAALAEAAWGAGAGYSSVFYISMGTGIGTGMVLRHRVYAGRTGAAGEGGHMTINLRGPVCACGKRGCIEMYASGTAIARRARERLNRSGRRKSQILELAGGKIADVRTEHVAEAASAGDPIALEILGEAADHFAISIWLGSIIDLLEPEIIVIGGGIAHLMMSLLGRIRKELQFWAVNPRWQQVPIVSAFYKSDSALVGAAALCLPRTRLWNSAEFSCRRRFATAPICGRSQQHRWMRGR